MKTLARNPLAFIGLAVLLSLSAAINLAAAAALPASRQAIVAYVSGDVRIDGIRADLGQTLGTVALIETGPGARCDIVFGGGNAFTVSQNAKARIDFASPSINVRIDKGGVTSVLKKLEKLTDRAAFNITTQQTVAAVRGTSFCVWCDGDSTYVCACNGRVQTTDAAGGNKIDLASAHHVARVYSGKPGAITVSEAGILHHNDASVESTAQDIGYKVDWTKIDD
jgi:hypothetical protein